MKTTWFQRWRLRRVIYGSIMIHREDAMVTRIVFELLAEKPKILGTDNFYIIFERLTPPMVLQIWGAGKFYAYASRAQTIRGNDLFDTENIWNEVRPSRKAIYQLALYVMEHQPKARK